MEAHVEDAKSKGAKVLTGGKRPQLEGPLSKGSFFEPTVLGDASTDMRIYKEETFGPAIPCFRFKHDAEAIKLANDTEYGLAAYFYTKARSLIHATSDIECSRVELCCWQCIARLDVTLLYIQGHESSSCTLILQDLARAWKAAEQIEYGMIGINETSIGSEVAPFGGLKHSGLGKELSKYGIEEFLSIKYFCFGVGYNKSL